MTVFRFQRTKTKKNLAQIQIDLVSLKFVHPHLGPVKLNVKQLELCFVSSVSLSSPSRVQEASTLHKRNGTAPKSNLVCRCVADRKTAGPDPGGPRTPNLRYTCNPLPKFLHSKSFRFSFSMSPHTILSIWSPAVKMTPCQFKSRFR